MSSYNEVNGVYANKNKDLLQDILGKEWGFDGCVISDWGGSNDHALGVKNGSHLEMPGTGKSGMRDILQGIEKGILTEAQLDERLDELLKLIFDVHEATENAKGKTFDVEAHHELERRAAEDSRIGIGIWLNEQSAREIYLKPFAYAVAPSKGNAHGIMSSFNRAGCIWTSASTELMENILRDEFGFDGVVLIDTYSESVTFRNAVREACHRYLYVIANFSADMNGFSASSEIVSVMPWWQLTLFSLKIAFFALGAIAVLVLVKVSYKEKANR